MKKLLKLFITCPRGLESVLAQELNQLHCTDIQTTDGGVSCMGELSHIYQINLHSRTASRVLLQLNQAVFHTEDGIYKITKNIEWEQYFSVKQTFKVKVEGKRAKVKSLDFIALKIKDAVCDRFRQHTPNQERPSVDKNRPNIRIHAFLTDNQISLFLDTSGEALFKRGYRQDTGEAPLRENLAAGLLLLAGYDGSQPFQDPFCGSGTIGIEAAWIALNRPAGLMRRFGFEELLNFDKALWTKIKAQARAQIKNKPDCPILLSDNDRAMTRATQENARAAEVDMFLEIQTCDVLDARPFHNLNNLNLKNGIMVSNPPYGVRLAEIQALHALYPQLGSWLKLHYSGWTIGMFTGDKDMTKLMRLSPKRKIPLFNGNLDCRLFLLDMVQGSNRPNSK